jgi:hypothetical protein
MNSIFDEEKEIKIMIMRRSGCDLDCQRAAVV